MPLTFPTLKGIALCVPAFLVLLVSSETPLLAQRTEAPQRDEELRKYEETLRESIEERGEEEEDVAGRHEWFMFQRRYPYSTIPAGIRAKAVRESQALEDRLEQSRVLVKGNRASTLAAEESRWRNIGPFNVAGRVRAILVHPTKSGTVFVGAATGGVWKTTGDFSEWTTTFDGQSALSIGAMEFDPTNSDIIYVGTGEVINSHTSQFNATPAYFGDGLFKSTDGGETWLHSGLSTLGTISDIYVRKDDPQTVYVTSAQGGGGFYVSHDGGDSWIKKENGVFFGMAVDGDNILLASASTVIRSTDAGESFSPTQGFLDVTSHRTSIGLAPSNPNRVYLLAATSASTAADVYVSDDGGLNWTLMDTFDGTFFNGQGHYNNMVAVHPTNEDIALIGGIDIYRTSNGGDTWTNTTNAYRGGDVHPDQHVATFDPLDPDIVYLGNDGGVYRSANTGITWQRISLSLPITQYYELGIDQSRSFRVYGGTQDNGSQGAYGSGDWAEQWTSVSRFGGDGFHVMVDEGNPDYIYAESQYGRLYRVNANAPQSFNYMTRSLDRSNSTEYDPGAWSTPIAMSKADQLTIYSGRSKLWRTFDYGDNWERLNAPNGSQVSAIGLSPTFATKICFGTAGGEVYFSVNGGDTWTRSSGIPDRYVTEVLYDPVDPNRVYLTVSGTESGSQIGHVFRSNDNGKNFVNITSTLPDVPTNSIAVDPENNDILYVANDIGVYVTLDGGGIWLPFNNGLPYVPVVDLEIHNDRHTLIAATHGRSMFEVSIDNPQPQPLLLTPVGGTPYNAEDTLDIQWAGFGETVRVLISFDGGRTFDTVAVDVSGTSAEYILPFIKSTNAIVRVETLDGEVVVDSHPFSVSPRTNTTSKGARGIIAGAIEIVDRDAWTVDRSTNIITVMRLPTILPTSTKVTPDGITDDILDLAYEEESGDFFLLTGSPETFTGGALYRMAQDGSILGQLPLPGTGGAFNGIAMTPGGLVVSTPGNDGEFYTLDPSDGTVLVEGRSLQNAVGSRRMGLAFDGNHLAQGVEEAFPGTSIPDAMQRIYVTANDASIDSQIPLVVQGDEDIDFYGIAFYSANDPMEDGQYYITSTDGEFYVLSAPQVLSVTNELRTAGESGATLGTISPNPFRSRAEISVSLRSGGQVTLELFDAEGRRVSTPFSGRMEAGDHTVELDGADLSSGIYHVILTGPNGDRDIRPAVLVR